MKDVYVLMFRNGDSYGVSQPMSKKEADKYTQMYLDDGVDVCGIELTRLFESDRYIVCPVKSK